MAGVILPARPIGPKNEQKAGRMNFIIFISLSYHFHITELPYYLTMPIRLSSDSPLTNVEARELHQGSDINCTNEHTKTVRNFFKQKRAPTYLSAFERASYSKSTRKVSGRVYRRAFQRVSQREWSDESPKVSHRERVFNPKLTN